MCLILEIPVGAEPLSDDEWLDVWERNTDGGAVVDVATGVTVYRGLDAQLHRAAVVGRTGIVVHWRKATSGAVDDARCHAFPCVGGVLLHNGVLPTWVQPSGDLHSDTSALVSALVSAGVDVGALASAALLDGIAGHSVIVVVPTGGGAVRWYGARAGETWRGRRYSNTYAWSAHVHGRPTPEPVIQGSFFPAWTWSEDDLYVPLPRTVRRGRR